MRLIFEKIFKFLKKNKEPKPLITHHQDLALLRTLRKRKVPTFTQVKYAGRVLSPFEKRIVKVCSLFLLIGCVWLASGWAMEHRVPVPAVGGRYREGIVGSPVFVNPLFSSINDVDSDLVRLIFSGLMRYDENGTLVPDLAERYTVSEDGKTYTFYLRKNVTWHDSKEQAFTARDVKFTFDLIQQKELSSPLLVTFEGVGVNVVDDYTVEFKLNEAYPFFLSTLTVGILPEHVWSQIPASQVRLARYNLQPIGTGPFIFKRLSKNETGYIDRYELERFDRFYREPPYIKEFIFTFFADYDSDDGAVAALRAQKIDGLGFVPSHLREKVNKKSIVLHKLSLPQYTALFFNLEKADWREKKEVREAMALALDRERIIRESLKGDGVTVESPLLPQLGVEDVRTSTPYALDQANALLDKNFARLDIEEYKKTRRTELAKQFEATETTSSTEGQSNIEAEIEKALAEEISSTQTFYRINKEKQILTLRLVTADTPEYRHTAELIAGAWQELGIKTSVTYVNPKLISRDVLRDRSYDVLLYGVIVGSSYDPYPFWHSSQVQHPGLNLSQYTNRTVDGLIEKIRTTQNEAERKENYKKFVDALLNDKPAIFLYSPVYGYMVNEGIQGIEMKQIFHPSDRFDNVTKWYIETEGEWKL